MPMLTDLVATAKASLERVVAHRKELEDAICVCAYVECRCLLVVYFVPLCLHVCDVVWDWLVRWHSDRGLYARMVPRIWRRPWGGLVQFARKRRWLMSRVLTSLGNMWLVLH